MRVLVFDPPGSSDVPAQGVLRGFAGSVEKGGCQSDDDVLVYSAELAANHRVPRV